MYSLRGRGEGGTIVGGWGVKQKLENGNMKK